MKDRTQDTLFEGKLICRQHTDGYRFSVDAVLLSHFCRVTGKNEHILDLCCGSGVIGLILAYRYPTVKLNGLEIQSSLVSLARDNIQKNNLCDRYSIIQGDAGCFKECLVAEQYDQVVCNPPYRRIGSGRVNISGEAMVARHEVSAGIDDFVRAAAYAVKNKGRVGFVYPAGRSALLIHTMEKSRLAVKRIQPVYSYPGAGEAKLVLVEAVKNGGEQCSICCPLYIYRGKNETYSAEVERMYRENDAG